jgi:O-antigen/teichoic acid export membrane protein
MDAGLGSAATFCMGFYAARSLEPIALGAYGLVFTAFVVATRFPSQLIFKPAEIATASLPEEARLGMLRRTLPLGVGPAFAASLAMVLWALLAPASVSPDVVTALSVTGMLTAFISPIQDHLRFMLHIGGASWGAAGMSGVLVGIVLASLWLLPGRGVPTPWVPFGALAIGNVGSLLLGLWMLRGRAEAPSSASLSFGSLIRSGAWLLLIALLPTGAAFVCAALMLHLAGPAAMGYAEASRVLGQPPWVLSLGLSAVLGPRSIRAAQQGDLAKARSVSRLFAGLMLVVGLPYVALVGVPWSWNPLTRVVPNAYEVPYLLLLSVFGSLLIGMDWPYRSELIGAGRQSTLARLESVANLARTAIGATAGLIGAFAIPVGYVCLALVRSVGYRIALRSLYRGGARITPSETPRAPHSSAGTILPLEETGTPAS